MTRVVDILRVLVAMFAAMLAATMRRMIGLRRRPAWGFALEVLIAATRGSWALMCGMGIVRFRHVSEALSALPSPIRTGGLEPRFVGPEAGLGPQRAAWFEPPGMDGPVLLYLHGGGFSFGSLRFYRDLIGALARASKARTLALEFRLAPEHRWPAAFDDCLAGYRYLLAQGIPPNRIVLAGDSSGGNLVLQVLLALRDAGEPLPAAGVALSPGVDFACSGASFQTNSEFDYVAEEHVRLAASEYLPGADPRRPDLSPLFADLSGLPPLLLQAGAAEVLVDQIREFATRGQAAGVDVQLSVYEDMVHVWHIFGFATPLAQQAIDEVGAFARRHASA